MAEKSSERAGKILLVMPGHGQSTSDVGRGYGEALADLGYEVLDYDLHQGLLFYSQAIRNMRLSVVGKEGYKKVELAIVQAVCAEIPVAVLKELPDMTIYITGQFIPRSPLELIRKRFRMPQILVLTESPYLAEMEMKMIPFYDIVFTNDQACVERYRKVNKNTFYLGTAFSKEFYPYKGEIEEEFQSDLFFVGSPLAGRAELLNGICGKLDGVDLKLFGRFGELHGVGEKVFDYWEGKGLKHEKIRKYLAGTKIGFNIFRESTWKSDLGVIPYSANPRIYEVMAGGAMLLTDFRPELEELFEVGKDLVIFKGVKDFLKKMHYYLEHEDERKKIAKRGQKKVLKNHSYENRAKELLRVVKSLKTREVK